MFNALFIDDNDNSDGNNVRKSARKSADRINAAQNDHNYGYVAWRFARRNTLSRDKMNATFALAPCCAEMFVSDNDLFYDHYENCSETHIPAGYDEPFIDKFGDIWIRYDGAFARLSASLESMHISVMRRYNLVFYYGPLRFARPDEVEAYCRARSISLRASRISP